MRLEQFTRTVRNNFGFLMVVAIMMCSVGTVLYLGSTRIYQKDAENQHQKALTKLSAAARTLDIFFCRL